MELGKLYRYPVKSLGGQSCVTLQPEGRGFVDDRRWMFTDAQGRFISQRRHTQLARFSAAVEGDLLRFRSLPDGREVGAVAGARQGQKATVTVWDDTFQATEIISDALYELTRTLGIPDARLFYMAPEDDRPVDPGYARRGETVSFADGFPYLIVNSASTRDLARQMGVLELDVRRFRPNIVINGEVPWAEDEWRDLTIGTHEFYLPKACARCVMVNNEPGTGERDLRVLATLARQRKVGNKVLFGMNACWVRGSGEFGIGDRVRVEG